MSQVLSLAGFQMTIIGRFWVAAEANDTIVVVNLADAYRGSSGQDDKARAAYRKGISLGFKELETNPLNAEVLAQIALSYAKTGDFAKADTFIKRARSIDKNNVNYIYDDAQINALAGHTTQALKALQESLERHYPVAYAESDPELRSLQNDPGFKSLMARTAAKP